jgi:hypothetical protein
LFLEDSAALNKAAIMHQELAELSSSETPAYSPDVVPSDYCFFPNLKTHLKGEGFRALRRPY